MKALSCSDYPVNWTVIFFFQAEDGIRDLVRSRGLGDVYKRQIIIVLEVFLCKHKYFAIDMSELPSAHPDSGILNQ